MKLFSPPVCMYGARGHTLKTVNIPVSPRSLQPGLAPGDTAPLSQGVRGSVEYRVTKYYQYLTLYCRWQYPPLSLHMARGRVESVVTGGKNVQWTGGGAWDHIYIQ